MSFLSCASARLFLILLLVCGAVGCRSLPAKPQPSKAMVWLADETTAIATFSSRSTQKTKQFVVDNRKELLRVALSVALLSATNQ